MRYNFNKFPNGVEISPNNRAKCRNCFEKVRKGTPRLITNSEFKIRIGKGSISFYGKAYICYECIDKVLKYLNNSLRKLKKDSKKLNNRISVKKMKILLALEGKEETKENKIIKWS